MKRINNHQGSERYNSDISIIKDSHLQLSLPSSSSSSSQSPKIATWKDLRLEYLNIPKGLIELLQTNGFSIEIILDYGPSEIAEKLGIDDYVAQIIFKEVKNNI